MLTRARKQREKIFDPSYERIGTLDDPCIYCGQRAWGWDHVPPLSYVSALEDLELARRNLRKFPCCDECNNLLSKTSDSSISRRREIVRRKLREKYKRILHTPGWSREELEELGYSLRMNIAQFNEFMTQLKLRLVFYTGYKTPKSPAKQIVSKKKETKTKRVLTSSLPISETKYKPIITIKWTNEKEKTRRKIRYPLETKLVASAFIAFPYHERIHGIRIL